MAISTRRQSVKVPTGTVIVPAGLTVTFAVAAKDWPRTSIRKEVVRLPPLSIRLESSSTIGGAKEKRVHPYFPPVSSTSLFSVPYS
jgi:hypothetical protein